MGWRIRFRVPDNSFGRQVALVLLDEAIMEQYPYRSPVPRDMLAGLINIISSYDADLIGLDVFLKNPTWNEQDEMLATAIKKSGRVVLVSLLRGEGEDMRVHLPLNKFMGVALDTGLADIPVDPMDQTVRKYQIFFNIDGQKVFSLSSVLYLLHKQKKTGPPGPKKEIPSAGNLPDIELDKNNRFFIDFNGPPSTANTEDNVIATFPASVVLTGALPPDWFRGKVVLVGAGYEDNTDSYRTPYYSGKYEYPMTPGVELHANALATMLSGKTITTPPGVTSFATILLFAALLALVEARFKTLAAGIAGVVICGGFTVAAFMIFEKSNIALPIVPFASGMIMAFALLTVYRSLTEGRQKRWIQNAFQMYLSPVFVEQLVKKPDLLDVGGTERELTMLFTDMEGFTNISEKMGPTDLVSLLNEYLNGLTQILVRHGGTLDKYQGDAIMAFWGAPLDQADHAEMAVTAALEMSKFSREFSLKSQKEGKSAIRTRMGLNTGKVVVGNIGSELRFDYTIIGDEVNLASRLEGANKQYGTDVLVGHSTYLLVKDLFVLRELDLIRVKGKKTSVKVYEAICRQDEALGNGLEDMLGIFNQGLNAYRNREWEKCADLFRRAVEIRPDDAPSKMYIRRCETFKQIPPDTDWDGVFDMKTK